MTPMPKYCQKCNFWRRFTCLLYRPKLRPLNSNLRACVAHHKVLDSTLGPPCITQRPLFNSTRRIWTAPRVALENTIGPSRVTQRPMNSTGEHHWAPYCHRETIEQYPESQQVPSPGTGDPYRTPEYHSETIEEHYESLYSPSCGTWDYPRTSIISQKSLISLYPQSNIGRPRAVYKNGQRVLNRALRACIATP